MDYVFGMVIVVKNQLQLNVLILQEQQLQLVQQSKVHVLGLLDQFARQIVQLLQVHLIMILVKHLMKDAQ